MFTLKGSSDSKPHGYAVAVYTLTVLMGIIGLIFLKHTFPLFLLVVPGFYIASCVPGERWEHIAMTPIIGALLIAFLTYGLALYDVYSPKIAGSLLIGANVISGFLLHRKKWPQNGEMRGDPWAPIPLAGLLIVLLIYFFYAIFFPFMGNSCGPYPAFAQMGLEIVRSGTFHCLSASESCYDTTSFFYTPAFPGIMAWIASFVPVSSLTFACGYLAATMLVCLCCIVLAIGYRLNWKIENTIFALLLFLPSYAVFRISVEIDSDTLSMVSAALFIYLLVRISAEVHDRSCAWGLVGVVWAYSWWVRMHLGILCTFTLLLLWIFSKNARDSVKTTLLLPLSSWKRPLKFGFLAFILFWGPFWEIVLWKHTGSPIAPKSLSFFGWKGMTLKPEFQGYVSVANRRAEEAKENPPISARLRAIVKVILYDFFPVVTSGPLKQRLFKSLRAIVHGNTFSGVFSLLLTMGLFYSSESVIRKGPFSAEGIVLLYTVGTALVLGSAYYYYKVLYCAAPAFLVLVGIALSALPRKRLLYRCVTTGSIFMSGVFMVSFLWAGIGTWRSDQRWGILKIPLRSAEAREWLKNYDNLAPALEYLKRLPRDEKFLFFHPEPGHPISFYLDHHPFWEDYHYDSQKLEGLHQLTSRESVLAALRALRIRHIILTCDLDHFRTYGSPEILPAMLRDADPGLKEVADSSGKFYRIFKVTDS